MVGGVNMEDELFTKLSFPPEMEVTMRVPFQKHMKAWEEVKVSRRHEKLNSLRREFERLSESEKRRMQDDSLKVFVFLNNKLERVGTLALGDTLVILEHPTDETTVNMSPRHAQRRTQVMNMARAITSLTNVQDITFDTVLNTHALLMQGLVRETDGRPVLAGALRTGTAMSSNGEKIYPAPNEKDLQELCDQIDRYFKAQTISPFQIAAYWLVRFLDIHPFEDGNGRIGRLFTNAILRRGGFPLFFLPKEGEYLNALKRDQKISRKTDNYAYTATTAWVLKACCHSFKMMKTLPETAKLQSLGPLFGKK